MPSEPLPNKREVMLALLAEGSVFIHLDPRGPEVRVPPWFKNQPQLVLQVGLNMAVPIPDLDVGDDGITCTLSFSRRPYYCSIPWKRVFGLVREGGPGLVWPDDVPVEVAAQVQAQGQKSGQKPGQKPQPEGRGRLRAVGSEPSEPALQEAEPGKAASPEPSFEPAAAVTPVAPVTPVAAVGSVAPVPAAPVPAAAERLSDASSEDAEAAKPERTAPRAKSGAKREIPSYLRVVK